MTDTQRIKDSIDVVDFIQEYVQLKAAGVNHKGLCPFHNEKSPSFMANRDRQSWYCFGCNKGGDIFTFLQEIEGMEFVEALTFLANRAGVELSNAPGNRFESNQKNRLKDIMREAARFYHHFLVKMDASKAAREYIQQRGLTQETVQQWQIGFIPDQWDLLTKYLLKKGHSIDDLVASGLTIKRDNANPKTYKGFYDRFRGRIMFPINDVHGYTVGFTGRVLVETEHSGGKYVNTPQTMLFDKSNILFGLDKAKKEMKQKDLAVIVEGQMDVIACHQAGMSNVVASSGTALTEMQVKLLTRYTKNLAMAFDADEAGQRAAKRGIDIAIEQGLGVRVIQIPEGKGKDPDECIKQHKEVWFTAVEHAQDIMQWYLDKALRGVHLNNPKEKQQVANAVLPEIARIPFAVERDHWIQLLSTALQVDMSVLRDDLSRWQKGDRSPKPVASRGASFASQEQKQSRSLSRLALLQEQVCMLILKFPQMSIQEEFLRLEPSFTGAELAPLYEQLKFRYNNDKSFTVNELTDGEFYTIDSLLFKADKEFSDIVQEQAQKEVLQLIQSIEVEWKRTRRKELEQAIAQAEQHGNSEQVAQLLQEVQQL